MHRNHLVSPQPKIQTTKIRWSCRSPDWAPTSNPLSTESLVHAVTVRCPVVPSWTTRVVVDEKAHLPIVRVNQYANIDSTLHVLVCSVDICVDMHGNHTEKSAVEMTRASHIWVGNGVWTYVYWEIFGVEYIYGFVGWGSVHANSMTSQRYRATYKMADMRYYGNVMTTTRWRLYVILHLQQYSRRLNLFPPPNTWYNPCS